MRLKNFKNKDKIINESPYLINDYKNYRGNFNKLFKNNNPLHIEIGCGKGNFIINMAINNPNINFIGIEKYDSVIARALQKMEEYELDNLKFMRMDALIIDEIFSKEITRIYLNFSDPWPKVRHENRRLTSFVFLDKYAKIFKKDYSIIQKTDNKDLYLFSLNNFKERDYEVNSTTDLYNSKYLNNNVATEYEEKFHNKGMNIYYINAYKKIK